MKKKFMAWNERETEYEKNAELFERIDNGDYEGIDPHLIQFDKTVTFMFRTIDDLVDSADKLLKTYNNRPRLEKKGRFTEANSNKVMSWTASLLECANEVIIKAAITGQVMRDPTKVTDKIGDESTCSPKVH